MTVDQWKKKIEQEQVRNKNNQSIRCAFLYVHEGITSLEDVKSLAIVLQENKTITDLNLMCFKMGDEGAALLAKALKDHPTITRIYFLENEIGVQGAKSLASLIENNQSLETFCINNNNIGDEGAKAIASALQKNNKIFGLSLHNNHITDEGAKAFIPLVETNRNIVSLELCGDIKLIPGHNQISETVAATLKAGVKKNEKLKDAAISAAIKAKCEAEAAAEFALLKARHNIPSNHSDEPAMPVESSKAGVQATYIGIGIVLVAGVVLSALGSLISMIIGGLLLVSAVVAIKKALEIQTGKNMDRQSVGVGKEETHQNAPPAKIIAPVQKESPKKPVVLSKDTTQDLHSKTARRKVSL